MSSQRNARYPKKNVLQNGREMRIKFITQVVPDAWFGQHIPLELHGLSRRSERVQTRRWEVYIIIGEKQ